MTSGGVDDSIVRNSIISSNAAQIRNAVTTWLCRDVKGLSLMPPEVLANRLDAAKKQLEEMTEQDFQKLLDSQKCEIVYTRTSKTGGTWSVEQKPTGLGKAKALANRAKILVRGKGEEEAQILTSSDKIKNPIRKEEVQRKFCEIFKKSDSQEERKERAASESAVLRIQAQVVEREGIVTARTVSAGYTSLPSQKPEPTSPVEREKRTESEPAPGKLEVTKVTPRQHKRSLREVDIEDTKNKILEHTYDEEGQPVKLSDLSKYPLSKLVYLRDNLKIGASTVESQLGRHKAQKRRLTQSDDSAPKMKSIEQRIDKRKIKLRAYEKIIGAIENEIQSPTRESERSKMGL